MAAIALRIFPLACVLGGFESIYRAGGERIYMPMCIRSRLCIRTGHNMGSSGIDGRTRTGLIVQQGAGGRF